MGFITGKRGRVKVGSTNIPAKRFRLNCRGQAVETTSGESGGTETYISGVTGADITFLIAYDDATGYFAAVNPNASYSMEFYPDLATVGAKFTGSVFIESTEFISELKDQTMMEVRGKANGAFTATGV